MAKTVEYEGYTIQSTPLYVKEWEKWQLRIVISLKVEQGDRTREFSSEVLYATEQEADTTGLPLASTSLMGR
jgi:hypothetical protein